MSMTSVPAAMVLSAMVWFFPVAPARAVPRLFCEEPTHDYGSVPAGQTVRHAFPIVNRGESDLVIERVRACCGATAEVSTNRVAPGAEALVRVVLTLRQPGETRRKTFYLHTNDPENKIVPLRLTGTVLAGAGAGRERVGERGASSAQLPPEPWEGAPLTFDPPWLNFGVMAAGKDASRAVTISPTRARVGVLDVYTRSKLLAVQLEAPGTNGVRRLTVTAKADMPPGRFNETITVVYRDFQVRKAAYRVAGTHPEAPSQQRDQDQTLPTGGRSDLAPARMLASDFEGRGRVAEARNLSGRE